MLYPPAVREPDFLDLLDDLLDFPRLLTFPNN